MKKVVDNKKIEHKVNRPGIHAKTKTSKNKTVKIMANHMQDKEDKYWCLEVGYILGYYLDQEHIKKRALQHM
jgi:hypothetical protein